jgi:hypothetical protein
VNGVFGGGPAFATRSNDSDRLADGDGVTTGVVADGSGVSVGAATSRLAEQPATNSSSPPHSTPSLDLPDLPVMITSGILAYRPTPAQRVNRRL